MTASTPEQFERHLHEGPTRVWISLRADGIELDRVEATCSEASRANGVATYEVLGGNVLFVDIPVDCKDPAIAVHLAPTGPPFTQATQKYTTLHAGANCRLDKITFEIPLELPRYQRPEPEPEPKPRVRGRLIGGR